MELSNATEVGLGLLAGDTFSDDLFRAAAEAAVESVAGGEETAGTAEESLSSLADGAQLDPVVLKQAFSALVTLVVEGARSDANAMAIASPLENADLNPERIAVFTELYEARKEALRASLFATGFNFPHIVGVDWRLDYTLKDNHLTRVNKPVYFVRFDVESAHDGDGRTAPVEFACSLQELADLVGKLKDATKQVERIMEAAGGSSA